MRTKMKILSSGQKLETQWEKKEHVFAVDLVDRNEPKRGHRKRSALAVRGHTFFWAHDL